MSQLLSSPAPNNQQIYRDLLERSPDFCLNSFPNDSFLNMAAGYYTGFLTPSPWGTGMQHELSFPAGAFPCLAAESQVSMPWGRPSSQQQLDHLLVLPV